MLPLAVRPDVWMALTPVQQKRIERLSTWPLGYVHDELAKYVDENMLASVILEYRRYLALSILDPNSSHHLAGPVDLAWHQHLLDTKDYWQLCSEVIGRFIHHVPHRPGDISEGPSAFGLTIATVRSSFDHIDEEIWSGIAAQCQSCRDDASTWKAAVGQLAA
jgi:hypothetical protein